MRSRGRLALEVVLYTCIASLVFIGADLLQTYRFSEYRNPLDKRVVALWQSNDQLADSMGIVEMRRMPHAAGNVREIAASSPSIELLSPIEPIAVKVRFGSQLRDANCLRVHAAYFDLRQESSSVPQAVTPGDAVPSVRLSKRLASELAAEGAASTSQPVWINAAAMKYEGLIPDGAIFPRVTAGKLAHDPDCVIVEPSTNLSLDRTSRKIEVLARLTDGASIDELRHQLDALARAQEEVSPGTNTGWRYVARPVADDLSLQFLGQLQSTIWVCSLLFALGIACASAALGSVLTRERLSYPIRAALGARIWQLIAPGTQATFFAATGGVAFGALTWLFVRDGIGAFVASEAARERQAIFSITLVIGVLLVGAFALLGLVQRFSSARRVLRSARITGESRSPVGKARSRTAMLATQVAVACVFGAVASAALRDARHSEPFSDPSQGFIAAAFVKVDSESGPPIGDLAKIRFHESGTLDAELAAYTTDLPFTLASRTIVLSPSVIEGSASPTDVVARFIDVSASYFDVVGGPRSGAASLPPSEQLSSNGVLVDASFALRSWARPEDGVNREIKISGRVYRVLAVVPDHERSALGFPHGPLVVRVVEPFESGSGWLVVRNLRSPSQSVRSIVGVLGKSGLAYSPPAFLRDIVNAGFAGRNERLAAFSAVTLACLLLVAFGLGGSSQIEIAARRKELAIRSALGETAIGIAYRICRRTMFVLLLGLVVGALALSLGSSASLLSSVRASDVLVSAIALGVVMIVSTLRPFFEALQLNPSSLLRAE